jgi:hypothetical protein
MAYKKLSEATLVEHINDVANVLIEENDEIKRVPKSELEGSGVSSWNDLTDKPFGEKTVMGDTLTWDGNTDGLETGSQLYYSETTILYRISEETPRLSDFSDGFSVNIFGSEMSFDGSYAADFCGVGTALCTDYIFIIYEDDVTIENEPSVSVYTFPKKGIYAKEFLELTSLTIPGYNGFERTEITPLPNKYLPESHQFGSEIKDVVVFDSDITLDEGYFAFDKPLNLKKGKKYNVSINGIDYFCDEYDGGEFYLHLDHAKGDIVGSVSQNSMGIASSTIGITNPTISLKIYINNDETITPIDKKYLPKALQFGSEIAQNIVFEGEITVDQYGLYYFNPFLSLKEDTEYHVTINGVEYVSAPTYYNDTDSCWGFRVFNPDGPYVCERYFESSALANTSVALKICTEEETITPIDKKYVPDSIVPYYFYLELSDYGGYELYANNPDGWSSRMISVQDLFKVYEAGRPIHGTYYGAPLFFIDEGSARLYFIAHHCTSAAIDKDLFIFDKSENTITWKSIGSIDLDA